MLRRFSAPCRAGIFTAPAAAVLAVTAVRLCSSTSLAGTTAAAALHPAVAAAVAAATAVERVALDELRLEMERDRDENALGNAPLPPVGWSVLHTQGSSTFQLKGRAALLTRPGGGSSGGGKRKRHWNADVTVDCRFESVDPSFHDAAVDLCEYVPFRVVIERRSSSSGDSTTGLGSSLALIADCAAVQSQLRIRRVFFAPQSAPEQAAALQLEAATGFPHSVFVGPRDFNGMTKELRTAVVEFLSACGVDDRMAEFVCQMGFYLEHEEYQLWLARLARFAESSALPSS